MIETKEIEVDLGNLNIKFKVIKNSEEILLKSVNEEETPVWVELWPASLALAQWIWDGPLLEGKAVLELGAGLGLPGVVAGMKAARVFLTDYKAEALEVAGENALLNGVTEVRTAVADWRSFNINETFDYIIGSDILYHPNLNPYLKRIFQNSLRPDGKILMADAGRRESLNFVRRLAEEGWRVAEEHIKVKQDRIDYRIYIFQLKPPAKSDE